MRIIITASLLAGALVAQPAGADRQAAYERIAAGDYAAAARALEAERRIFPARPELMLNLAAAYTRLGRDADARALYRAVLDQRAVAMDLPSGGVASSHALATQALGRLPLAVATR